ncbi:TetR/AcrR family transcriptional regulator [Streptomyces sp. NRRL F-5053]|uniref:TetR/AcrR family transcriptional regulator n=1 Tax=Streptomyces sp. NRRL F-5053 TaxID=1463854 RepID=UPI00068AC420|nr:TetR/AcrR family transcriptional regulator [Streptomyces sp. NRRL F-5053]
MPRPPRLSRTAAVTTALRILDEEGPGALSMRRLAQRLDVTSPSLYKHFRDLDDLLDAVADAVARRINAAITRETEHLDGWRAELSVVARCYCLTFRRHPHTLALVMRRPLRSRASLAGIDDMLAVLLGRGWGLPEATRALLLVESYAMGAAFTAASAGFVADSAELARHPALSAALSGSHPDLRLGTDDFEHGLTMLLDGIARDLAPKAARETARETAPDAGTAPGTAPDTAPADGL